MLESRKCALPPTNRTSGTSLLENSWPTWMFHCWKYGFMWRRFGSTDTTLYKGFAGTSDNGNGFSIVATGLAVGLIATTAAPAGGFTWRVLTWSKLGETVKMP